MEWMDTNITIYPFIPVPFQSINGSQWPSPLFSRRATANIVFSLNVVGVPLLSVGIFANVINIFVFSKQGFKESINVSLTSITVSDLACLVHMLWQTLSLFPFMSNENWSFSTNEVVILTGSIPRVYFSRVSSMITVYIALERCVSVINPFHVKFVFTRKRLIVSMVGIYVVNAFPIVRNYYTTRFAWKINPLTNKSYLGVIHLKDSQILDSIGLGFGIFVSFSTFTIVAVCAVVLVCTLFKQKRWRHNTATTTDICADRTKQNKTSESIGKTKVERKEESKSTQKIGGPSSDRDKRAAKTVTLLALMFVFCYLPEVLCQIAMLTVSQFSRGGIYRNSYNIFWLLSLRAEGFCAGANIVVYFNTSTKFRETMLSLFCPFRKTDVSSSSR